MRQFKQIASLKNAVMRYAWKCGQIVAQSEITEETIQFLTAMSATVSIAPP